MIKSFSLAAMAVLVLVGCNSGGDSDSIRKASVDLSSFSEAEKLAYAIANKDGVLESVNGEKSTKSTKSRSIIPCDNGTMEVFFSVPIESITEYTEPSEMIFHNCKMDGEILDGSMKAEFDSMGEKTHMSFPNGFSITGGEEEGSIQSGGYIDLVMEGEWEVVTINMVMTMNGVVHGGEDLVYKMKVLSDGSTIEYPVSGKEKIGDSAYFTVDPDYDASETPFKTNANDELVSGKFKYLDSEDHAVELEITGTDIVTVRVDTDGNGSFVGDEVSSINLR